MYIKLINGTPSPYSIRQLRIDNPNVSFPSEIEESLLKQWDVYVLNIPDIPEYDKLTQKIEKDSIVLRNDSFLQLWKIVNFTDDELALMLFEKRQKMSVTPRQARLALLGAGKLSEIELAIAGLDEPTKSAVTIEWEYATQIERNSEWVIAMTTALGMVEEEVDALFEMAATL